MSMPPLVHENLPSLKGVESAYKIRNLGAVEIGEMVLFNGLTAVDLETGEIVGETMAEQAKQAFTMIESTLGDVGLTLDHIIKVNGYLAEPVRDFPAWNEVFIETFDDPFPVRTTVGAPLVAGLLEVDFIAAKEPRLAVAKAV
jgi:2-iminobutanoate/2-iminopropanoate deaminase